MKTQDLLSRAQIAQQTARDLRLHAQFERTRAQALLEVRRYLSAMDRRDPSFIERETALENKRQ